MAGFVCLKTLQLCDQFYFCCDRIDHRHRSSSRILEQANLNVGINYAIILAICSCRAGCAHSGGGERIQIFCGKISIFGLRFQNGVIPSNVGLEEIKTIR